MKPALGASPLALFLASCAIFSPIPDTRTPGDRAREVEPRCKDYAEASNASVLSPAVIDSVEPAYSFVPGGPNAREAHLRGARVHMRPLPGVTREALTRTLECHQTRVTLGASQALPNDPWVAPGAWLDIDVDSDKDGFVAEALTDDLDVAKQVLERARRFAAARP
jgi:hypothetical protein